MLGGDSGGSEPIALVSEEAMVAEVGKFAMYDEDETSTVVG
jgi:hypothetical protein